MNSLRQNLLGMSFLSQVHWQYRAGTLVLEPNDEPEEKEVLSRHFRRPANQKLLSKTQLAELQSYACDD